MNGEKPGAGKRTQMKITKKEASEALAALIKASPLIRQKHSRDLEEVSGLGLFQKYLNSVNFSFELNGIWGGEARLEIKGWGDDSVRVIWSSTDRSLAMANVTIELYRQVVLLASEVQAFMNSCEIKFEPPTKEVKNFDN